MIITSNFDGGAIDIVSIDQDHHHAKLAIRGDKNASFKQWFYFRVTLTDYATCFFELTNAGEAAYLEGFQQYKPCVSYDGETWFRMPAEFDGESLKFQVEPVEKLFYIAYFHPYTYQRHMSLIDYASNYMDCEIIRACSTIENRDLDVLKFGQGEKVFWLIGRQHPGETMAEWFMEGFIEALTNQALPHGQYLMDAATLYIVPNMNPDGSFAGNLRTNASGANLNREWLTPSIERSPEVYYVRQMMHETGVDLFLDIHGDEAIPYNFVAGSEGVPNFNDRIRAYQIHFKNIFENVSCEFQTEYGYSVDAPGEGDCSKATNYIANEFGCLAYTLEMPFKDNHQMPDENFGWSAERSKALANDVLVVLNKMLDLF